MSESIEVRVARLEERDKAQNKRIGDMAVEIADCRLAIKDLATETKSSINGLATETKNSVKEIKDAHVQMEVHAAVGGDRQKWMLRLGWLVATSLFALALKALYDWAT